MIKTILVATDGSGHAKKAVELGADIAGKYDARIVILHVLLRHMSVSEIRGLLEQADVPEALAARLDAIVKAQLDALANAYENVPYADVPPDADLLREVAKVISDGARKAAEAKGVKDIALRVVDGAPAECILAAAKDENADMIVMGSRGLGGVAELLMGSVSHKVTQLAPCSCVTVK